MPSNVNQQTFRIQPAADLLQKHPDIMHLSNQLALRYAHHELVDNKMLQTVGQALCQAVNLDAEFDALVAKTGPQILPITLESADAAILQLPWEALYHAQQGFFSLTKRLLPVAPNSRPAYRHQFP